MSAEFQCPTQLTDSVLIVDHSADSREVPRTVLENRGLRIFEAEEPDEGYCLAQQHRPRVIVFSRDDAEEPQSERANVKDDGAELRFHEYSTRNGGELVILASLYRPASSSRQTTRFAKPYHYGPLIRKIESLVERTAER